jgi:hypothetical protein
MPIMVKDDTTKDNLQSTMNRETNKEIENEKILCLHCQRTASNGIKCKGICVADSDY